MYSRNVMISKYLLTLCWYTYGRYLHLRIYNSPHKISKMKCLSACIDQPLSQFCCWSSTCIPSSRIPCIHTFDSGPQPAKSLGYLQDTLINLYKFAPWNYSTICFNFTKEEKIVNFLCPKVYIQDTYAFRPTVTVHIRRRWDSPLKDLHFEKLKSIHDFSFGRCRQ